MKKMKLALDIASLILSIASILLIAATWKNSMGAEKDPPCGTGI